MFPSMQPMTMQPMGGFMNQSQSQSQSGGRLPGRPTSSVGPVKWMDKPAGDNSILAHLKSLSYFSVRESISLSDVVNTAMGHRYQARYGIHNDRGETIYTAYEESDDAQRMMCPTYRHFVMHIYDHANQEVITIRRREQCCGDCLCCIWCSGCRCCACCGGCGHGVTVESPPGTVIGYAYQGCTCIGLQYYVADENHTDVLKIEGPACVADFATGCCCSNKFTIYDTHGSDRVGSIEKQFPGFIAAVTSVTDTFTMQIPQSMDPRMKAVALAALFLIDIVNFSGTPKRRR